MPSIRTLSYIIIFLAALLVTARADADDPSSIRRSLVLRPTVHQVSCKDNTDCIQGCICGGRLGVAGNCVNTNHVKQILQCKKCSSAADCTRNTDLCSAAGVCESCEGTPAQRSCEPTRSRPKNTQKKCRIDSDCKTPGCRCSIEGGNNCYDPHVFVKSGIACKRCSTDSQCPNSECASSNKCLNCLAMAFLDGMSACHTQGSTSNGTNNFPASNPPEDISASQGSTTGNPIPLNFTEVIGLGEKPAEPNSTRENSASDNNSTATVCVASSWLRQRGLEHAAIRHAGVANVLCVPGLPCATSGHLLRECNIEKGGCKLVTYREVYERCRDCAKSAAAVSQLSHNFDWSQYIAYKEGPRRTLELTSLSAHSQSGPSSPSRLIANVADLLNSMGLGSICNAFALFPHRLSTTFVNLLTTKSS